MTSKTMATINETTRTYQGSAVGNLKNVKKSSEATYWKPVTIGGFGGILMGAGAMYAVDTLAADKDIADENGSLKVVETPDDTSFEDAFGEARRSVGPGGVFRWHGNIYNTYTREEWETMSEHDRNIFAERVRPEIAPDDASQPEAMKTADVAMVADKTEADEAETAPNEAETPTSKQTANEQAHYTKAADSDTAEESDDVQLVSTSKLDMPGGFYADTAHYKVSGEDVVVIDVDNDDKWDVAIADLNHDGVIEDNEVVDLRTGRTMEQYQATHEADNYTVADEQPSDEQEMTDTTVTDSDDTNGFDTVLM